MPTTHRFRTPDDFHLHLREGELLKAVLPASANNFARALIMPNLKNPILNVKQAESYRSEILSALKNINPPAEQQPKSPFEPLMTLYLTEETTIKDFGDLKSSEKVVFAGKLYFACATTNAHRGVSDITRISPLLADMEKHDIPLSIHGEMVDENTDIFDREKVFVEQHLAPLLRRFPNLRITLEHITTELAVSFIREHSQREGDSEPIRLCATITPHHLLLTRNDLLSGGLRPHYYCLPLVKREADRLALVAAASSGESCFFLGTDSAPHRREDKESACGCAGIFNAPYALACVLEACQPTTLEAIRLIEKFTSTNGAYFHSLPLNSSHLTVEQPSDPESFPDSSSDSFPEPSSDSFSEPSSDSFSEPSSDSFSESSSKPFSKPFSISPASVLSSSSVISPDSPFASALTTFAPLRSR